MSKPLAERFLHFDSNSAQAWDVLVPSDQERTNFSLGKYARFLANNYVLAPGERIEFSERQLELIDDAKRFVEQVTGMKVSCEVNMFTRLFQDRMGIYNAVLHHVGVTHSDVGTRYGDDIAFGSLVVHELLHSTAIQTSVVLDIENNQTHAIHVLQPHHLGEITPSFRGDNFFEEGLAEEIASRWRLQFDPKLRGRDRDLIASYGAPGVPVRMYSPSLPIDETNHDIQRGNTYSAHCAFGIQILSEYTGTDLIELLLQARHPEKQKASSESLKQVVNSIDPDLYDILTSADYSENDFIDCVSIIKDAIAAHAHTQLQ